MDEELPDTLQQAEDALNTGRIETARLILIEYLQRAPRSERAWWLLSFAVPEAWQKIDCIERLLRFHPGNEQARERLARLREPQAETPPAGVNPFVTEEPAAPAAAATFLPPPSPPAPLPEPASGPSLPESAAPGPEMEAGQAPAPGQPPAARKKRWLLPVALGSAALCLLLMAGGGLGLRSYLNAQAAERTRTFNQLVSELHAQTPSRTLAPTALPTDTFTPTSSLTRTPSATPTETFTPRPSLTHLSSPTRRGAGSSVLAVGQAAPDFSLVEVGSRQNVSLGQFAGRPVLLFFWATWCPVCKGELPSLELLYQQYLDRGLVVIGVSGGEAYYVVNTFLESHSLTFHVLVDPDSQAMRTYRVEALPRHFFITPAGLINYIGEGGMDYPNLQAQVEGILAGYATPGAAR